MTKARVALLAVPVLASCAETDERAERQAFNRNFTDAVLSRDFNAVYPLVQAEMNRQTLENGREYWVWDTILFVGPDDSAVYGTGWLLALGFEVMVDPQRHPEDYDEEA